jgi:hypothetical protein
VTVPGECERNLRLQTANNNIRKIKKDNKINLNTKFNLIN